MLELLRTTENEKFVAMLVQFLLLVSKEKRFYGICGDNACVPVQCLVARHDAWKTETVTALLELIKTIASESPESTTAMQRAQVQSIVSQISAKDSEQQVMSDRWQNVKLWDLGASPAKMVSLLRNSSPLEQVLLLRCLLLADDKSPRQLLLQQHDSAAILGDLVAASPYAVKKLAIELAQTAVMTLDVDSRSQLIDFQVRHRHVPLLSLDFLKTLVDYQYVILPEVECREFLETVRTGTAARIYDFADSRHGMEFLYFFQRGLFPTIFERMRNESTSDDVLGRLWWLLLYILEKVVPYPVIDDDDI